MYETAIHLLSWLITTKLFYTTEKLRVICPMLRWPIKVSAWEFISFGKLFWCAAVCLCGCVELLELVEVIKFWLKIIYKNLNIEIFIMKIMADASSVFKLFNYYLLICDVKILNSFINSLNIFSHFVLFSNQNRILFWKLVW